MKPARLCAWSSALACALAAPAGADGFDAGPVRVQAFAAVSLIGTTNHNFFGETQDTLTPSFSEFGVNAMWQPHERFRLSGQVLHRRAGESDDAGLRIDYAQADWTFFQNEATRVGLKFGKPKLPYGLYNETRDVPFTRPGVLLPQSIYFDSVRDFIIAAPGGYLHGSALGSLGSVEVNLGVVRPDFESDSLVDNLLGNVAGTLRGRQSYAASLRWDMPTDTTVAAYWVDLRSTYRPGTPDIFPPGDLNLQSLLLSLQQRIDTVTLTAELAERRTELTGFNIFFIDRTVTGRSGYVQAEWRFHPDWEAMLRLDQQYTDISDRDTPSRHARDLTLGLRWDVNANVMLRAEWHHVDGTGWLPRADNPAPTPADEARWNMLLFQFAYRY